MENIFKRAGILILTAVFLAGCAGSGKADDPWLESAELKKDETPEELYEKALSEDILIVYTVSTRVAQTKDSFEKAYPGLYVEVRDLRSPNLIEAVEENYNKGLTECDVVLCNDNSGDFKARLVDTGIVVPYVPSDIAEKMKPGTVGEMVSFVNEAEMLFYNASKYDTCPIGNIWELTDGKYKGKIYLPNPLRSFSTYSFCTAVFDHADELKRTYKECFGTDYDESYGDIAEYFWTELSKNAVFTNSSDEAMEALGNGSADFGIIVSSKLRFKSLGYNMEPVYRLDPFSGSRTSYSVMLARNSKNVNTAKLFIRYLLGEADGAGEGYKPFCTEGTWSARVDVSDATPVPLEDIDLIIPDQGKLISEKARMETFWAEIIKKSTTE